MTSNFRISSGWLLSAGVALLALWILRGFLPALAWAVVIAVASWPLYKRFERRLPPALCGTPAALLFTLLVTVLFIAPLVYALIKLGAEGHFLSRQLRIAETTGLPPPDWLGRIPGINAWLLDQWNIVLGTPGGVADWMKRSAHDSLFGWVRSLGQQLLHRSVVLLFTLLVLFFLYRDGEALVQQLLRVIQDRLGERGNSYVQHAIAAVRATVNGLVLVGLGEGILIGIAYAFAGLPSPALWGALTGLLAMIPFAAPIVFGAAALFLAAQGAVVPAIAVAVWGTIVLFVADHFVRPILIGGAIKLPFLWVLLGILGGLETLGLLGLFLGPVIMALAVALWREWTQTIESKS
jgi:predicted PurR-regulated permease PerM